jgi:hypothetical protein
MWTGLGGKDGIAYEKACKTAGIVVDGILRDNMGISVNAGQPVDRMLIGRHESNSPSNNHYKESYKILWKKLLAKRSWG